MEQATNIIWKTLAKFINKSEAEMAARALADAGLLKIVE